MALIKKTKILSALLVIVLMLMVVNSLMLNVGAATVATKQGDVEVLIFNITDSKDNKGSNKPDTGWPINDSGNFIFDGVETPRPLSAVSVAYLNPDKNPGKLPATGSNNMLVTGIIALSAVFMFAYIKSGKTEQS